ncbi:MAG: hypothetical protein OHK0046_08750 [Anaerolineae bacterium]
MRLQAIMLIMLAMILAACQQNPASTIAYSEIPAEGDAARGAEIFNQVINLAPACSSCHNDSAVAAPVLDGYSAVAGTRVEGQDAREYTFYAIAEPGRHIVSGYGNAMYNQYDEKLTGQQLADLIAYLLSL